MVQKVEAAATHLPSKAPLLPSFAQHSSHWRRPHAFLTKATHSLVSFELSSRLPLTHCKCGVDVVEKGGAASTLKEGHTKACMRRLLALTSPIALPSTFTVCVCSERPVAKKKGREEKKEGKGKEKGGM